MGCSRKAIYGSCIDEPTSNPPLAAETGIKNDEEKPRIDLLPEPALVAIAEVYHQNKTLHSLQTDTESMLDGYFLWFSRWKLRYKTETYNMPSALAALHLLRYMECRLDPLYGTNEDRWHVLHDTYRAYRNLPWKALTEVSKVLTFGANKYSPYNWQKGFNWSRIESACKRHIIAWQSGEELDPETGLSHLAHAVCNLLFLVHFEVTNIGEDDRPESTP